jgi:hypothetical protein
LPQCLCRAWRHLDTGASDRAFWSAGYDAKEFSDPINPLKRYLRTRIGKPWRKVHSELSRKLDRRSVSGSHIWDHVLREIEIDCYIGDDGLAYSNDRTYMGRASD